jgi:hypothetical protein
MKSTRKRLLALALPAIAIIAFLLVQKIRTQHFKAITTQARGNLRSMGHALLEFQTEHGRFPDDSTAAILRAEYKTELPSKGHTSNDFLRQLIAAQMVPGETIFHAAIPGTHKPDNIYQNGKALEKGECGFSYIVGLDGNDLEKHPHCPIVLTPLIPGTTRFDPKPFNGQAIILRLDNSVAILPIQPNGDVLDPSGNPILSPNHSFWNGEAPQIAWPD